MKQQKGFTFLEIITVVIILSILSIMSMTQFIKAIERQHGRNVIAILKTIRGAQIRYYLQHNTYASNFSDLDIDPNTGDTDYSKYFTFQIEKADGDGFVVSAIRKSPSKYAGAKISIDQDGNIQADPIYDVE